MALYKWKKYVFVEAHYSNQGSLEYFDAWGNDTFSGGTGYSWTSGIGFSITGSSYIDGYSPVGKEVYYGSGTTLYKAVVTSNSGDGSTYGDLYLATCTYNADGPGAYIETIWAEEGTYTTPGHKQLISGTYYWIVGDGYVVNPTISASLSPASGTVDDIFTITVTASNANDYVASNPKYQYQYYLSGSWNNIGGSTNETSKDFIPSVYGAVGGEAMQLRVAFLTTYGTTYSSSISLSPGYSPGAALFMQNF